MASMLVSIVTASMASIRHSDDPKAALISDWLTRRGPMSAWLPIAEAQQVVATSHRDTGTERGNELSAILIVEDVKQPAVKHGVELLAKVGQPKSVPDKEPRRKTAVAGLALRKTDRLRNGIDTGSVQPPRGGHECVFTGSASDIQDTSCQHTVLGQLQEGGLGPPDVPRRGSSVIRRVEAANLLRQ